MSKEGINTLRRVAISGAGGFVGRALVPALETQSIDVLSLVRRSPSGPDELQWDTQQGVHDLEALSAANIDAVIHLAGENVASGPWTKARKQRIYSSRVEGTRALVKSLQALDKPPHTFLCASGISIYPDDPEACYDESGPQGESFLAEVCRDWEAAAAEAAHWGARVVCLRIGPVLGAQGGMLERMLPMFRLGLGAVVGRGDNIVSWISHDDLTRVCLHCLQTTSLMGPVNAVAPHPVTQAELAQRLAHHLKRPAWLKMPALPMRWVLRDAVDEMLLASQRVRPQALLDSGFVFQQAQLDDALQHVLAQS